jgi:hypothetical protein
METYDLQTEAIRFTDIANDISVTSPALAEGGVLIG